MKGRIRTAVGILLSILLLWWALRDVSFTEVLEQIRRADPFLFVVSILLTLVGFWFRAVRWGVLLLPSFGPVALRPRLAATFIGFAANNLLPARVGEFARAFSLSRITPVPTASALATLVIERVFDGIVVIGLLFAAMATAGFPASSAVGGVDLRAGAFAIAGFIGILALGLAFAVAAPRTAAKVAYATTGFLPDRARDTVLELLRGFARGLAALRSGKLFAVSALLALAQWVFTALSYYLGFRAFGIEEVPFAGAVFMQSLISLAVAIPSSPGFFGPFEAAARLGLGLWGVPADQAISFAIGYHIGGFLPVTIIGVYYVWRLQIRWSDVRQGEEAAEDALDDGASAPATVER